MTARGTEGADAAFKERGMASDHQHLPEGTVTVLSSDAVGSTQLKQRLGDEAGAALEPRPVPRPHHFGGGGLRP